MDAPNTPKRPSGRRARRRASAPKPPQGEREANKESGMSNDTPQQPHSPLAQVFQEAYQKAVLIKRMDEQISQIAARRKALCDELRTIQSQLNNEFTKLVETGTPIDGPMINVPQPDFSSGNGVHVSVHSKAFGRNAEAAVA